MKKLLSVLLTALLCCSAAGAADVSAGAEAVSAGDADANGILDTADAALLQGWLLGRPDAVIPAPDAADLSGDGRLDAADLTLMKQLLYSRQKQPDAPPISALRPSMPSVGTERIPVFAVRFADCDFSEPDAAEWIDSYCFLPPDEDFLTYPLESASAYLERASYGRLKLTGDVFTYTTLHPIGYYAADDAQSLAAELMAAFDEELDFTAYDADRNQILDAMVIVVPDTAMEIDSDSDGKPDWWPFSVPSSCRLQFDGVRIGTYCAVAYEPVDRFGFVRKTAHELCHAMGLPDYYKYTKDATGESDGMIGAAGIELMDEGTGDLSACSKLLLGWIQPDEVTVYTGGTLTYTLTTSQLRPDCIMIPKEPDSGFLSEYFLIEYAAPIGNNAEYGSNLTGRGVRILHVQAETAETAAGTELKYANHSPHYDKSNQKQRVLRLVNDYGVFYPSHSQPEAVVDGNTELFRWYDENGALTVIPDVSIRIGEFIPGPASADDPAAPYIIASYPNAVIGGSYQITVSPA